MDLSVLKMGNMELANMEMANTAITNTVAAKLVTFYCILNNLVPVYAAT
jgi:hypothetical protein